MNKIILDSSTNSHMSPYREQFTTFKEINPPKEVQVADKTIFLATGIESMKVQIPNGERVSTIILKDVLYSPSLAFTLVSITSCNKNEYLYLFNNGSCILRSLAETFVAPSKLLMVYIKQVMKTITYEI